MSAWESFFDPAPVPEWLEAFAAEPARAVDELLWRRFYFGPLHVEEPEELLIDWAVLLGNADRFMERLDRALALWVRQAWGEYAGGSTARLADAWSRLAHVVTNLDDLNATVEALRVRFPEKEEYLGPISVGPSRDPLGRYLGAVAVHQQDRSLAPYWWRICDLPPGVPFYHAVYGISGLLALPAQEGEDAGGFREEVVHGLARLAYALDGEVKAGIVPAEKAREDWLALGRLAMARLPFVARWREIFEREDPKLSEEAGRWAESLLPGLQMNDWRQGGRPHPRTTTDRSQAEITARRRLPGEDSGLSEPAPGNRPGL